MPDQLHDTLELDPLTQIAALDRPRSSPAAARDAYPRPEAEPTTLTIPAIGGGEAIVLDQPDPGARSIASLTLDPRRARIALSALAVGAFATGANEASIVALSPQIAAGLGVPVASIGLLATAFALTVVVAAIPLTVVTQRLGRRLALGATMAVWTGGVVLAATAGSLIDLAAGRIVSAAAHALFWAVVAPTATSLVAPHLRPQAVTRIMLGAAAAGVVGTPLLTVLATHLGWHAPYWVLGGIGAALAVTFALVLPSGRDDAGAGSSHARGDVPSLGSFLRVLAVTFTASVAVTTTWTYAVPYVTEVAGLGGSTVPVMLAIGGIVAVASTLAVARFLARWAVRTVAVGLLVLASAWLVLEVTTPWAALAGQVLQAAGWAILLAALLNWAMRHSPWRLDVGASTYTVAMNSGAAIGPLLGGIAVSTWGLAALPYLSLGLTVAAGIVTATVDRATLLRLHVPRTVRTALAARGAVRERRREWTRRVQTSAGSALRGHVTDLRSLRQDADA